MSTWAAVFWLTASLVAWVYVGYPALAALVGLVRPFQVRINALPRRPLVTVGIAAFNEAHQLSARIANILEQAGPFDLEVLVASDGSSDGSIPILERISTADRRVRYLDLPRAGQTAAQNAIFASALGEFVVLSDAETRFRPNCLARLLEPFSDARVGCTTGRLEWLSAKATTTSRQEGAYWRYEQLVRRLESGAGWLTAVTGALLAVRRVSYREVPAHASMDHLLPLYVRAAGLRVVAVSDAVAVDRPISGVRAQFHNRARTATRGIRANLSMALALAPWREPSAALAIWSHKLLRWATPCLLALACVSATAEYLAGGSIGYLLPLVASCAGALLAVVAWVGRRQGVAPPRVAGVALAIAVVNAAFLVGWWNLIRGRRIEAWHRTSWSPTSPRDTERG